MRVVPSPHSPAGTETTLSDERSRRLKWQTTPDIDEEVEGGVVARAKQVEKCLETEESGCGACGACGGR